jgi:hypothetical protein
MILDIIFVVSEEEENGTDRQTDDSHKVVSTTLIEI